MTEEELKQKLTYEFLNTLTLAVRVHGWNGDWIEIEQFARWCAELAGKEIQTLEPF